MYVLHKSPCKRTFLLIDFISHIGLLEFHTGVFAMLIMVVTYARVAESNNAGQNTISAVVCVAAPWGLVFIAARARFARFFRRGKWGIVLRL